MGSKERVLKYVQPLETSDHVMLLHKRRNRWHRWTPDANRINTHDEGIAMGSLFTDGSMKCTLTCCQSGPGTRKTFHIILHQASLSLIPIHVICDVTSCACRDLRITLFTGTAHNFKIITTAVGNCFHS